jgi:hypothetical protein
LNIDEIKAYTAKLNTIKLEDLISTSSLQTRLERKYLIELSNLPQLLGQMVVSHKVLKIDEDYLHNYSSTYFDTPELMCFRAHNQKRRVRYKIRTRHYTKSGLLFFELKQKTKNMGTKKTRIQINQSAIDQIPNEFLKSINTPLNFEKTLIIEYDRITLVQNDGEARVTFDLNLKFKTLGNLEKESNKCIIEVKSKTPKSKTDDFFKAMGLKPMRLLSKYCIGVTSMDLYGKKTNFDAVAELINEL